MPLFLCKQARKGRRKCPKPSAKVKKWEIRLKNIPENAKIALKCHFCACKNNAGAVQ
jgi:hypothetical protein